MIILKCMGIFLSWFLGMQIAGLVLNSLQIQYSAILTSQIIMLFLIFFVKKKSEIIWNKTIWNEKEKINVIYITGAVFTGIGTAFFNQISVLMSMNIKIPEKTGGAEITLSYVLFTLMAAIVEEFFYRGTIMNLCMSRFKAGIAIFISSLFFCIGHLSPVMFLHTFVCGILCGYYYYYSGRIMIPVTIHFINNLIWGCIIPVFLYCICGDESTVDNSYSFSEGEITITVMSVIIGIMIITITAIWMKKYNRKLLNQKGEEE